MRHLVVCCDGTWNTPDEEAATNVYRLHNALADTAEDGAEQLRYYDRGVGTEGGLADYVLGGAAGAGLSRNVLDAYHWLTTTYQPGDHIALFGFSRGAYTVRSLAAMVAACGLLDTTSLSDAMVWRQIDHVYHRRYQRGDRASPRHIRHARHAVALDERRSPFSPALWDPAPNQDLKQMWFPGSHLDVGGGHREKGLSDGALHWMIEQARDTAGLAFHKTTLDQIRPDPLDVLHDDNRIFTGWLAPALNPLVEPFFAPRPRAVPLIDAPDPSLHESVSKRHQKVPITGGPYRTTRILAAGESATVRVHARDPWNWTELYLEPDEYSFTAQGQWVDRTIRSGPEGTTGPRRFLPTEGLRLLGTLFGRGEMLFRRVIRNWVADFLFTRREEDLPWMSLVGVVANDATEIERELKVHERIRIGAGTEHRVTKAGYLYAFANDAWGFYG
ncbi:MAG: DUF2235 domain-containing protein, partial [Chloroflexota bacterium]